MPTVRNTTRAPLAVPLPGGKKLRLGPLNSGQVTGKALDSEPVRALIEAGTLELGIDGGGKSRESGGGDLGRTGRGHEGGRGVHRSGDR
ncbi:MAG: hypothetical protein QF903_04195 [Planctomycetota bacterium]|jgi:hypothetical protein|nr:hypothetical protein [Planctomycetota bacterium]MDP6761497.1 hypothetical protein [Planctomycetota bacterium]MDP6988659.1 hypothetical protein [Planctomycetota bacterium]